MKGLITMISCIFLCTDSFGQEKERNTASISMDILSFINSGTIDIVFSHPFHTKWSAEGGASVLIPDINVNYREKQEHEDNLGIMGDSDLPEEIRERHRLMIGMRYWPKGYLDGPHLSLSSVFRIIGSPDIVLGGGYAVEIWKGIGTDLGYRHTIINAGNKEDESIKGIDLSIYYRF
jgi:hypothetical protein